MKTRQMFILLLLAISTGANGKTAGGVYMNESDYRNNKLTYQADCAKERFQVHLHDFFGHANSFTVTNDGKKHRLQKNNVYGYCDCNNNVYRFYANTAYKIVEAGNIYIYARERNVAQTKGFAIVTDYFFSVAPDSKILSLNAANLEYAYCDNEKFLGRLDGCRGEVTGYDNRHQMFRINYLYTQSLK